MKKIRAAIRKGAPKAQEKISYGMPGYRQGGMLVYFAAFKDHCSLFVPPSSDAYRVFRKELSPRRKGRSAIHFPLGKALPLALITKVAKFRVVEKS